MRVRAEFRKCPRDPLGPHAGPGTFETGDPDLGIERANSLEGTLRLRVDSGARFDASLWRAQFSDYIYGQLTGRLCDAAGVCGRAGELKEMNYAQQSAAFWGAELKGAVPLGPALGGDLSANFLADYVRATFADGGDILTTQDLVMIGLSARTDHAGAEALQSALAELGRKSEIVTTPPGVLHFKTDCSLLDEERILSTRRLAASGVFSNFRIITVPEGEEAAANALRINDVVLVGADHPRTIEMLQKEGFSVAALKTTEIGKIDAGLSCMSLRWFDASQSQSDPA